MCSSKYVQLMKECDYFCPYFKTILLRKQLDEILVLCKILFISSNTYRNLRVEKKIVDIYRLFKSNITKMLFTYFARYNNNWFYLHNINPLLFNID